MRNSWCVWLKGDRKMRNSTVGDAAIAVVRRNTEEVQGRGNWDLYEELFADDFIDHTPQPGTTPDKDGVRVLYKGLRAAFPDFRPEIHWQVAAGDLGAEVGERRPQALVQHSHPVLIGCRARLRRS